VNETQERAIIDVVEHSIVAARADRARVAVARWADGSRVVGWLRSTARSMAGHAGVIVLSAAVVHVALIAILARPAHLYWLILPSMAAAAGAALLVGRLPHINSRH
jgi:hypothetical protein